MLLSLVVNGITPEAAFDHEGKNLTHFPLFKEELVLPDFLGDEERGAAGELLVGEFDSLQDM